MKVRLATLATLAALSSPPAAQAHRADYRPIVATAYCACEGTGATTYGSHGNRLRPGDVAMRLPYGTRIRVTRSPTGRHVWTVRDYPGGTDLDFFVTNPRTMDRWGRRGTSYRVIS